MAFVTINLNTPQGSDRGKILDENIREFKNAVAENFAEISGYPNHNALVTQTWTTAGRPTAGLVAGLFGWNTDNKAWDRYTGSSWEQLDQGLAAWTIVGRPSVPYAGQYGFNSDLGVIERYTDAPIGWVRVVGGRRGDIKVWSGAVNDIEAGWVLCDGVQRIHPEGGTYTPPNLLDKFIIGAGGIYAVSTTGGEAAHTLTIAEMPNHNHTIGQGIYDFIDYTITMSSYNPDYQVPRRPGGGGAFISGYTGNGQAHNNLPPYYALCFLYKI